MLKSNGPSMAPCGSPNIISDHEMYVPFNLNLCLCLVNYKFNCFKEGISTPQKRDISPIKKGYLAHKEGISTP